MLFKVRQKKKLTQVFLAKFFQKIFCAAWCVQHLLPLDENPKPFVNVGLVFPASRPADFQCRPRRIPAVFRMGLLKIFTVLATGFLIVYTEAKIPKSLDRLRAFSGSPPFLVISFHFFKPILKDGKEEKKKKKKLSRLKQGPDIAPEGQGLRPEQGR
ncbi:unnamed protein product [Victoria cruziana]